MDVYQITQETSDIPVMSVDGVFEYHKGISLYFGYRTANSMAILMKNPDTNMWGFYYAEHFFYSAYNECPLSSSNAKFEASSKKEAINKALYQKYPYQRQIFASRNMTELVWALINRTPK